MRHLYETKSSNLSFSEAPDSYSHPNHGEPVDLGSDSSDLEELEEEYSQQVGDW